MAEKKKTLDRRAFLAATAASAAAISLSGCAPENKVDDKLAETGEDGGFWKTDEELSGEGQWVPIRCQPGCGGECGGRAYVVDGIVVRTASDNEGDDSIERPQRRRCPRGRAARQTIQGADRIRYPMKRKHWEPLTGGDKSLRGKDEWERISWDEALDYVAAELQHAIDNYGNQSIYSNGGIAYDNAYLLNSIGACGCVVSRDTVSHGTAYIADTIGIPSVDLYEANTRDDLPSADTVVLHGMNPVWASAGNQSWYVYEQAKEKGAQFVYVGPDYNVSASLFEAKWIHVRPGTDTAFLLAVAYETFKLDEEQGGIIDWDFLDKYTVGIDGNSMPADAKVNENFRDYLFGAYDGQQYNAEWASPICGASVEDIKWYANEMRKDKAVMAYHSFAPCRVLDSENFLRLFMTIAFMGGHIGKPGHTAGAAYHAGAWRSDSTHFTSANGNGYFEVTKNFNNTVGMNLQATDGWQSIIDGKYVERGSFASYKLYAAPEERDLDIHVIFEAKTNTLTSKPGILKGIEAYRKVDFAVTCGWFLNPNAQYSDIILPITILDEEQTTSGAQGQSMYRDHEAVYLEATPIPTPYEARDIRDVMNDIAARMGAENAVPETRAQYVFDGVAGIMYNDAPGGPQNLVSVTQEDIDRWGVQAEPQDGYIPLSQLESDGIFKHENDPEKPYIGYADFIADPEANPRDTPSGKFEIYSQSFADALALIAFDTDYVWKPYPAYKPPTNGYGSDAQKEYCFQMFTPHYLRRNHTLYDNNPYMREAFEQPVFVNAQDAEELGIKMGDTVLVSNQYGKVLRRASVVNTIMPGVIALPHGAWVDLDEETGIDRAGASNVLTPQITTGTGTNGYNSTLVNIELWTGDPLPRDCEMPLRTIEA